MDEQVLGAMLDLVDEPATLGLEGLEALLDRVINAGGHLGLLDLLVDPVDKWDYVLYR